MNVREPKPEQSREYDSIATMTAIEDTKTGEVHTWANWESLHHGEWSDFWWADGNGRCDCNRALFFRYAVGMTPDEADQGDECGSGRYRVCSIVTERGLLFYSESE